ncbi:MAG: hypothetical protein IT317_23880 [Anaerolineales bacterium]|nr:hypothetical protein [Anaerolineales bacterium]
MAEIPLYEEGEDLPTPRPRAEVRITEAAIRPYSDGRRMRLHFALTPFEERPSLEAVITNPAGADVASVDLIEAMDTAFDFTLHLRGPEPDGPHTLRLTLFYRVSDDPASARQIVDERTLAFSPRPERAA